MTVRRTLGEAVTVHERNVESAIGRVPPWQGKAANYTPLVGGLMNQNWLVEVAGDPHRYFVKVPGEGSEMFIDRVAANEAARNAHAMGIAPEVIFFDATDGLEVSEFLEGYRACTNGDFGDAALVADHFLIGGIRPAAQLAPIGEMRLDIDEVQDNQDDHENTHDQAAFERTQMGEILFHSVAPASARTSSRPKLHV